MALHTQSPDDLRAIATGDLPHLFSELGSSEAGLRSDQAQAMLQQVGPNRLPPPKRTPLHVRIFRELVNLFNVLLVVAAVLSLFVGLVYGDSGSNQMGLAILGVVVVNIVFSIAQERRAESIVEALSRLIPANVKVLRDGRIAELRSMDLVPGDVISLEEGDRVPADARLLRAFNLQLEQSSLTGESEPVERTEVPPAVDASLGPLEQPNLVFAGTVVSGGAGTALVFATGVSTQFGRIVETTQGVVQTPSPLQNEMNRTGKINFLLALVAGLVFLALGVALRGLGPEDGLLFMIGVMVSLVPEGLQMTVTLALALSSVAMSRRRVVVKRLSAVETLGSVTVICTDKTGTVTTGQMTATKVFAGGRSFGVSGEGYDPEGTLLEHDLPITPATIEDLHLLLQVAALDNKAVIAPPLDRRKQRWTAVGDTTDAALLVLAIKGQVRPREALASRPRLGLIPFDSGRKMMSSAHQEPGGGVRLYTKGAVHAILDRATAIRWEGKVVPLDETLKATIEAQAVRWADEAFRVLALAYRDLEGPSERYESERHEQQLIIAGLVAIHDPPRADAAAAVAKARQAGIRIFMLTGDHEATAAAIAREVGILKEPTSKVVTGARLAEMSDEEVAGLIESDELVFAKMTPKQKFRLVKALRAKGEIVAVTGDGANDAPALAEADIGIAMGITGTDVAREAAAMVLLDDNFASIVEGVQVGRSVFDNLRKFLAYVFTHNFAQFVSFIAFVLMGVPPAVSVVFVLATDLVMEIPPSLALTAEPPEPEVMAAPPRALGLRLFGLRPLLVATLLGVVIGTLSLLMAMNVWAQSGWHLGMAEVPDHQTYLRGATIVLAGIMIGQMGNLLVRRTNIAPLTAAPLRRNGYVVPGIAAAMGTLLALIYVPPLQGMMQTAPLQLGDWLLLLTLAPLVVLIEESRKGITRLLFPTTAVVTPVFHWHTEQVAREAARTWPRRAPVSLQGEKPGPPVLYLLPLGQQAIGSLPIALSLARRNRASLMLIRPLGEYAKGAALAESELAATRAAHSLGVKLEIADLELRNPKDQTEVAVALRRLARKSDSTTIVVPVSRRILRGAAPQWLEALSPFEVVLVAPRRTEPEIVLWPSRLLIPVFGEFHPDPFDVATALSADSVVPNVDVVATRVIEVPRTAPLYSIYTPQGHEEGPLSPAAQQELSIFERVRVGHLGKLRTNLLLVRNERRDVLAFAKERQIDAILLHGNAPGRYLLDSSDRSVALNGPGLVIVTVPHHGDHTTAAGS